MSIELLQLCSLTPALEASLNEHYKVHRWFETKDQDGFLTSHSDAIKAVVTGGHIGIPNDLADRLPNLEIVAINGVGFDKVDLPKARTRGYHVSNTPDVLTADVADTAIGLIIAQARHIARADAHVRKGEWPKAEIGLGTRVTGRRYGIFGLGRIGKAIARRLEGFDGQISYTGRSKQDVAYTYYPDLLELAQNCDVLIIAAAASSETRHAVDAEIFAALGSNGVLINVARGSLVDETALIQALKAGQLGGAGLDVFENEPTVPAELFDMPNVTLTPHIGSATHQTRKAMGDLVLANLAAHFSGKELVTPVA
ncbi:2-hydroxyacid dehydrogenase [Falsochrobactrum sp. TDYN1]|uniref:2-hydroxyacid dehydrogenase n=1 Tax=Falsochrobactrum tianjinense TaxID=2706015 RepID=A0A949UUN0_9HYPH|nr:2-hydroxyacid dehydrogenase [Falsochrobactrum sp. TDYN1]MBV2143506.1 2-hydroxyacid dehydrogenase [Falsochrobactrum sp. TDYN1]